MSPEARLVVVVVVADSSAVAEGAVICVNYNTLVTSSRD